MRGARGGATHGAFFTFAGLAAAGAAGAACAQGGGARKFVSVGRGRHRGAGQAAARTAAGAAFAGDFFTTAFFAAALAI